MHFILPPWPKKNHEIRENDRGKCPMIMPRTQHSYHIHYCLLALLTIPLQVQGSIYIYKRGVLLQYSQLVVQWPFAFSVGVVTFNTCVTLKYKRLCSN